VPWLPRKQAARALAKPNGLCVAFGVSVHSNLHKKTCGWSDRRLCLADIAQNTKWSSTPAYHLGRHFPINITIFKNPFDVAKIRNRVALFVSVDVLSAASVSPRPSLWTLPTLSGSVDFDVHRKFTNLDPNTINKNGHLIRTVKSIKTLAHLD